MNFNRYKARYPSTARPANLPYSYWWTTIFGFYFFFELYSAILGISYLVLGMTIFTPLVMGVFDIIANTKNSYRTTYIWGIGVIFIVSIPIMFYLLFTRNNDFVLSSIAICIYSGGILAASVFDKME